MGCGRLLRKTIGVLLILLGIGMLVGWEVLDYHLRRPVDTDIESILRAETRSLGTVRLRGRLSRSAWTVWETEEETGRVRGARSVYDLTQEGDGQTVSIYVVSDRPLEEGEEVTVEGALDAETYGLRGPVIHVRQEPPIPLRWAFACGMLVFVLLGITLLVYGPRGRPAPARKR